ncbi:helix-turn-helix domain-containing protein [Microbispora cellulosiformans]|uniref:Helix-turn-helix domain-containing protein n=1 Tax=Microbispora cellulosiformans TaxID=2614688 RepID=A0A5J5JYK9_9ACTN|nr:helix-turn-helix transcriptional regulator [Microbispora cellulosiformans]KAA9375495.1 helix-turn-helix domain-containing protein [Microbispora cellulosiformans]
MASPTVRRRRLSAELVRLREQAGFSVEEAGRRLEWSRGRLNKMEANKWTRPDLGNIRALLDLYSVTNPVQREAVLTLARQSREKGWWASYQDVWRGSLAGFEAEASLINTYEDLRVPGLLQTEEYATAMFKGGRVLEDAQIRRRVEARMARQSVLHDETPPTLWAVIDEAALSKAVGGSAVMRQQLRHLVDMSAKPNIYIQVLPDSAGAHAAMDGAFTILNFPDRSDPSIVYIETATSDLYLETPEELERYSLIFDLIRSSALSPELSVAHLTTLIEQPR